MSYKDGRVRRHNADPESQGRVLVALKPAALKYAIGDRERGYGSRDKFPLFGSPAAASMSLA